MCCSWVIIISIIIWAVSVGKSLIIVKLEKFLTPMVLNLKTFSYFCIVIGTGLQLHPPSSPPPNLALAFTKLSPYLHKTYSSPSPTLFQIIAYPTPLHNPKNTNPLKP
jgi:hypothetical protein